MKIILDTNVILSSLLTQGLSYRVFTICSEKYRLYISKLIITELSNILLKKIKIPNEKLTRILSFIDMSFIKIDVKGKLPEVCRDKDDNNILLLAEYINADLLITGDKDLLILNKYKETEIINPRFFIEHYYNINT